MRAFIALELPATVQAALAGLQRELAGAKADVKWVREEQLHVTLRFLGEITEPQRQTVEGLLREAAGRHERFQAGLSRIGAFPTTSAPRVIWAGIEAGRVEMERLARDVEEGLSRQGFPAEDRPFVAHVTLGRVRSSKNLPQLATTLKQASWTPPPAFPVDHITLFQSALSSAGPTYTPLAKIPLAFRIQAPTGAANPTPPARPDA